MKNKIYFVCPNNNHATGGVKQIYRQVETLNKNGFDAYILHKKNGKKDNWFNMNVPIVYSPFIFKKLKYLYLGKKINFFKKLQFDILKKYSEKIEKNAILVFPEIYGPRIHEIEPATNKVIFNQNCYYTFNYYSMMENYDVTPYNHSNTLATIVASEDAKKYLDYAFASSKILKMRLGIDQNIFSFSSNKEKQICFMPRKLGDDVNQVINILKQRNSLKGWTIVPVDNKTELEVANLMKKSVFFLSFNYKEGFGLPPVEAMSCGCYVIGYRGQAGKEYFKPEFSTPVEDGDIIEFVKKIEEMIKSYEKNPQEVLEKGKLASIFVSENYSLENEEKDTLNIWNEISPN
ncbi:glycosyltransferase [Chryseobacterium fistulae]|uniref:Alpha-1,6-glucosyltransferase n=1 Tax=Chryseobacterium fistulae TaxID=2675058 RepID=A0A6N4XT46_9FLAO|nr:glycosyltransferase [Chryseobacterium fistulae]CAA7392651.1 Alpha-1,6-glucosyltransferase [Chryseobacterium fistulae]